MEERGGLQGVAGEGERRPVVGMGKGGVLDESALHLRQRIRLRGRAMERDIPVAYLRRLKRIEGQVRGIARRVDEDKYCIDILTQVSAVNKALHAVSIGLLEDHIAHCVVGAAKDSEAAGDPRIVQDKVKEASDAIGRLLR